MDATPTISLWQLLSPLRLLGPLSDRELRIASRRVRSYALRSGYLLLLCILMLSAWYRIVGLPDSSVAALGISRASVVSRNVAHQVLVFQFAAAQFIAAVMLSSSFGDEMRRGTFGVLMTTPIMSLHIVLGKLVGGLLQTVLLLALGLPALAVLRVFGGVSWECVLAGFCITLTAAGFAGALSLLLSTYYRHPFGAISAGAIVYLILFAGLPFAVACWIAIGGANQPSVLAVQDLMSPFRALSLTVSYMGLGRVRTPGVFQWPLHCLVMAGLTAVLAYISVWRLRRLATGDLSLQDDEFRPIERLHGSPVAWKEDPQGRWLGTSSIGIGAVALTVCVLILISGSLPGNMSVNYQHYGAGGLWLVAILRLTISVAGGITREKESGAWQVLLTTPLAAWEILRGKAVAALRRNAPLLLAALAIRMCFILCQPDPVPVRALNAGIDVLFRLVCIFFVVGAGLYFGVRLRTTTLAVTATIVAFLCLNYLLGGSYNPLFAWLWTRVTVSARPLTNSTIAVYLLSTSGTAFVLNIVLGFSLWRRARRNVRVFVF